MIYRFSFWFEHGGGSIWPEDDATEQKYGYPASYEKLPLSKEVIEMINTLEVEYHSCLDWNCPQNPSPWTEEHWKDFRKRAKQVYDILVIELGEEYQIEYKV